MSVERQRSNTDVKHAGLFKPFIIINKRSEFYLLRWDLQFNRAKPITCENWASFTRNSDHCVTHLLFFFSLEQTRRHLEVVVETTARKPEPPAKIRIVSERHTYPEAPGRIGKFHLPILFEREFERCWIRVCLDIRLSPLWNWNWGCAFVSINYIANFWLLCYYF